MNRSERLLDAYKRVTKKMGKDSEVFTEMIAFLEKHEAEGFRAATYVAAIGLNIGQGFNQLLESCIVNSKQEVTASRKEAA